MSYIDTLSKIVSTVLLGLFLFVFYVSIQGMKNRQINEKHCFETYGGIYYDHANICVKNNETVKNYGIR